jgi:transposase-like protein
MVAENQEKSVMTKQRKNYSPEFKAKLALAAIRGEQSMNQLSTIYGVHPNQIGIWKKQAQEAVKTAFNGQAAKQAQADAELTERLYSQIGQLKVELDWLKKKVGLL